MLSRRHRTVKSRSEDDPPLPTPRTPRSRAAARRVRDAVRQLLAPVVHRRELRPPACRAQTASLRGGASRPQLEAPPGVAAGQATETTTRGRTDRVERGGGQIDGRRGIGGGQIVPAPLYPGQRALATRSASCPRRALDTRVPDDEHAGRRNAPRRSAQRVGASSVQIRHDAAKHAKPKTRVRFERRSSSRWAPCCFARGVCGCHEAACDRTC